MKNQEVTAGFPSALREILVDFYARVEWSQELAAWQAENLPNGEIVSLLPFIGMMAHCRVRFFPGRRFDFDDEGIPAIVIEVLGEDASTPVDLVAWPARRPDKFAPAIGHAAGLGVFRIRDPATYFGDEPLKVYRTPLAWLQASCDGVVILNSITAPSWLGEALGAIAGEDINHARALARLLRGYFDIARIVAPIVEAA